MNIKFFNEVNENDIVGGKGSSLAKMYQSKFNVPNGYIITVDAFNNFLIENNVKIKIEKLIAECNINNEETIKETVIKSMSLSLKRNILTSITTLTAIIVLLLIGTSGVKEFNITVLIGLISGTFSSLFLAPYIWLKLEIYRLKNPKKEKDEETEIEERRIKGINS